MTVRVYGRVEYAEPLTEVGTFDDGADLLAAVPGDWLELITFPEGAIQWIIRDGADIDAD